MESTRLDRWLWAVRLTRTRPDAAAACRGGHVRVNDRPAKPSTTVSPGDEVRALVGDRTRIVEVVRVIQKRVGAADAVTCYLDRTPPPPPTPSFPWLSAIAVPGGRPNGTVEFWTGGARARGDDLNHRRKNSTVRSPHGTRRKHPRRRPGRRPTSKSVTPAGHLSCTTMADRRVAWKPSCSTRRRRPSD